MPSAPRTSTTVSSCEIADPLGTAEAWLGAAGPRHQGAPLPPVTPALQAALAAAELAAHVAVLANATAVSTGAARLLGSLETAVLGFGMTFADRADGSEGADVTAYYVAPVPLNASLRSPLAVRPVFVRLTARDAARGGRPLHVRTSSLRWLLPGPPPPPAAASPAPRGVSASGTPTASSSAARPGAPAPVAFDAHTACAAWKALRRNPATWNPGLPQCPQTLAQLSRSQWVPLNECPGLNGSVATAEGAVDAWGVAPCWVHRGRVAFGEADARSCFVSAVTSATHAAASCCYDADGRLLRTGASSASDARFAPYPAPLSHVFAHQLPHLVCCRLASGQGDCDGTARTTGNSSWRGVGGAAGAPYFVTLDGATLAFNGAGDFVFLGVKTAPSVATPRIASLPATPGRLWGALPAGVSFLSLVRLLPLSLLYPAGSPSASVIQGWAAVTAAGEHVSVTVRGGQLQVHVNGTMLPLWTESGFLDIFTAGSTFARTRGGLVALARTARFGAGNGTAAAAAAVAAREALASGALDSSAADVTYTVGNVTVVFSRAQRRVRVLLPHVGVAVTVSQVRSVVAALDGALLHVAADVAPAGWNRTFGLLGNFDGVTANDVRTHGEPPLSAEAAVYAAVNTALKVAAPNAAFVEDLPTLPSPYTPVFSAALRDPGAVGVDIVLLNACGIAANVTGSSGALPFAQSACYLYGSVTDTADIAAATLQLARELEQAAAAARGPAPEFVNPPDSFALVEGRVHNITLSASVPVFLPGRPAEAVSYRVQSTPSGACSIGERSGVLVCGPLAISAAGLTPASNGCNATGVIVVTASSRVTSATTHHRLFLEVAAGLTGSASWSPSLSGSASAATSNTASGSTTSSVSSSAASTSSGTVTASATASRSATLSGSGSATSSGTVTASATASRSATLSGSGSCSVSSTATASETASDSATLSNSGSATSSTASAPSMRTSSASAAVSSTATATMSAMATASATVSMSPSRSTSASLAPSFEGSASSTYDGSPSLTAMTVLTAPTNDSTANLAAMVVSGPMSAHAVSGAATGAVVASLLALAAFFSYRRRVAARGEAPKAASAAAADISSASDSIVWHDRASLGKPALPDSGVAKPSGGSPAVNPVLLAQYAASRRPPSARHSQPKTARASFAPQASTRNLEL